MSDTSIEGVAFKIIKRGIELDQSHRYTEALVCYQEGLQILLNYTKGLIDPVKKTHFRTQIQNYITRAEKLKKLIEEKKASGSYHEQIMIENNSTGHSYQSIFGRFLDSDVSMVEVEDPYVRSFHQCQNLLRLCELLIKSCENLKTVKLLTTEDSSTDQGLWFDQLKSCLNSRFNVVLIVQYSSTLHDRQIILNNGWIIKIGRGLDYFKAPDNKLTLGVYDLDLRLCHETTVDIFHKQDVRQTYG